MPKPQKPKRNRGNKAKCKILGKWKQLDWRLV